MKIRFRTLEDISKLFILIFLSLLSLVFIFLYIAKIELIAKAEGVVEAENWTEVRPKVGGIIKEMLVAEGDRVKMGEPLFSLEDSQKRTALLNANLELERLNLEKREAEDELILFKANIKNRISEQEAGLSTTNLEFLMITKGPKPEEIDLAKAKVEMASISEKGAEASYRRKREEAELGLTSAKEKERARFEWEQTLANLEYEKKNLSLLQNRYGEEEKKIALMKVKEAEARLSQVRDEKSREESLRKGILKTEKEIEKEQNEIELLKKEAGNLLVYSEADGVILTKETQHLTGKYLEPGEVVLKIGKPKDYVVKAFIKEKDRPKVKCGQ
ncbi:MAG: HlyD family efflux transporter periplasmic adaptor subunit, partial [Candidatus Desantisbacteria bacterium]